MPATLLTPPILDDLDRRGLLTGTAALAILAACARETTPAAPTATTRTFTHALGTAEIPVSPQRVVALNITAADPALTLGVPVVGVRRDLPPTLEPLAADVEQRLSDEPDLESIAALRPDLILSAAFEGELFEAIPIDTLSVIAPTIAYGFESDYAWRDYYCFFADALGRVAESQDRLARLDERIAAVAAAVPDPAATSVSVIRVRDAGELAYFRTDTTFASSILDPIGFAAPPAPEELSLENIGLVDADVLFVFAGEVASAPQLDALLAQPIYQTLGAVQAGRAFPVGAHWFGFGVLAAEAILDDVERAFA